MGCPPWSTHCVEAVGAEEYGLFLDSVPQLSARPLFDRYACWLEWCVLPSWLDNTLRWGHPIQLKRRPPPFMGLVETRLRDPAASTALAAEVARLLVKGAITVVPPPRVSPRVLFPLLPGFQEVRGKETDSGSSHVRQIRCREENSDCPLSERCSGV